MHTSQHPRSTPRPLRVCFLTTLAHNPGDEFIREGVRAVLDRSRIPSGYTPLYVSKHDPRTLHEPREDETLIVQDKVRECDLFIQSGAPVYWHLHNGKSRTLDAEWHAWVWLERVLAADFKPVAINLGAGSTFGWNDPGQAFLNDADCVAFAKRLGERCALTVVRDPTASALLATMGVKHELLPCPAFLAAQRHTLTAATRGLIGVNLMRLGGHWALDPTFNRATWMEQVKKLLIQLRTMGRLVFICHDAEEEKLSIELAASGERIFPAAPWRSYFDLYRACECVVANRVHGAVAAAGFGVPGIVMGNDTRAQIAHPIGLPTIRSAAMNADEVSSLTRDLLARRASESERLLELRRVTLDRYTTLLAPVIHQAIERSPPVTHA